MPHLARTTCPTKLVLPPLGIHCPKFTDQGEKMGTAFAFVIGATGFLMMLALLTVLAADMHRLHKEAKRAEREDRVLRRIETWSLTEFDRDRYIAQVEEFLGSAR